jgi:curved DNA-binding protein
MTDYYEFLQISPHADADTIHRVYRFLAARFHPDNPQSGDADLFCLVRSAYEVLSDPDRRAEYDEKRKHEPPEVVPLSASIDFMDDMQGELNRRLALLAVLYHRRRTKPDIPEVPLDEIETRMGFPRDYLDFTIWYLGKKGYITRADNAQFSLTAEGVDFVEAQRVGIPMLNKLLTNGSRSSDEAIQALKTTRIPDVVRTATPAAATATSLSDGTLIAAAPGSPGYIERRLTKLDRRQNSRGRRSTD